MKNMSLFKVTGFVITAALASNFVNAEVKTLNVLEKKQSDVVGKTVEAEEQLNFASLIDSLDSDKNGKLSQTELSVTSHKLLQAEFTEIDTNQDTQIDETEFSHFLVKIKEKAIDIAKTNM